MSVVHHSPARDTAIHSHRRRRCAVIVALALLLPAATFASIAVGARPLPLSEVWSAAVSPATAPASTVQLIREFRLPRTVLGLLAGLALGAAGAVTRGHTRNPLADPGLLGVSSGAALCVVVTTFIFDLGSPLPLMIAGLLGAGLGAAAVFTVAVRGGAQDPLTLVIAGTGVTATLTAMTSAIVLADASALDTWRVWNVGSLAGRESAIVAAAIPFILAGLILAAHNSRWLSLLELGDDTAAGLGAPVRQVRVVGMLAVALLVGAATAACGPIGFLGVVVTYVARFLVGTEYRWALPVAAATGALTLLVADVIGRVVARPGELEASMILALVGAPLFVAIVRMQRGLG